MHVDTLGRLRSSSKYLYPGTLLPTVPILGVLFFSRMGPSRSTVSEQFSPGRIPIQRLCTHLSLKKHTGLKY